MHRQITSINHPLINHIKKIREKKAERKEHRVVFVEGSKLIKELCLCAVVPIILLEEGKEIDSAYSHAQEIIFVSETVLKKISDLETPEGVAALVNMPELKTFDLTRPILALDKISDPGNLGTLIRSALALGFGGAFLLEGSCDLFNDKALRAARGATFRLPCQETSWIKLKEFISKENYIPIAADLQGIAIGQLEKSPKTLLVLGNEGSGLSSDALQICNKVTIPISNQVESLNVSAAGAILMYEFAKIAK